MGAVDCPAYIEQQMKSEEFKFLYLSDEQQKQVKAQLKEYDFQLLKKMREQLTQSAPLIDSDVKPLYLEAISRESIDEERGLQLLKEGKIACLVLAGGQGTRLGIKGPKGCLEVSPLCHKSLFALICEKIKAASRLAERDLEVAIMTSPQNCEETRAYFEQHHYFGLRKEQIVFYEQNMLPLLDEEGELFLEESGHIAEGPDGNGRALHLLGELGIADKWAEQGVDYINVIPIDNPLADPFDYAMIGYFDRMNYEVLIKAVEKKSPEERVGVIGESGGHLEVIEYSELPSEQAALCHEDGSLHWNASNTGLFAVKLSYVQQLNNVEMPWHIAAKEGKKIVAIEGQLISLPIQTRKFETFIFDSFKAAERYGLYPVDRSEDFSPIKRPTGADSTVQAKEDLIARDKKHLKRLGIEVTSDLVECDPALYYLKDNELNQIEKVIINGGEYYTLAK